MHVLRYLWLVGDGDISVYHSVVTGVLSYGHDITKDECTNHTVKKCYQNRLEVLCYDKTLYRSKYDYHRQDVPLRRIYPLITYITALNKAPQLQAWHMHTELMLLPSFSTDN